MNAAGRIVAVSGEDEHANVGSIGPFLLIEGALASGAHSGRYVATAGVYPSHVQAPAAHFSSDAIAVELDHRGGYSMIFIVPYRSADGKVILGEPEITKGQGAVFP